MCSQLDSNIFVCQLDFDIYHTQETQNKVHNGNCIGGDKFERAMLRGKITAKYSPEELLHKS